jgi:hypothetical protein
VDNDECEVCGTDSVVRDREKLFCFWSSRTAFHYCSAKLRDQFQRISVCQIIQPHVSISISIILEFLRADCVLSVTSASCNVGPHLIVIFYNLRTFCPVNWATGEGCVTGTIPCWNWDLTILLESKERNTTTVAAVMVLSKSKNCGIKTSKIMGSHNAVHVTVFNIQSLCRNLAILIGVETFSRIIWTTSYACLD